MSANQILDALEKLTLHLHWDVLTYSSLHVQWKDYIRWLGVMFEVSFCGSLITILIIVNSSRLLIIASSCPYCRQKCMEFLSAEWKENV